MRIAQPPVLCCVCCLRVACSGTAVYSLSLPVMLLLGEGAAGAGLVAGVQEALSRNSSSSQPLVIYMPRLEVRGVERGARTAPEAVLLLLLSSDSSHCGPVKHGVLGGGCLARTWIWRHAKDLPSS